MAVLDVASGSGEPAISLARAVGPQGRVTATDLVDGRVAIAAQNAREAGMANLYFRQADVHSLPFADQTFDLVTCRFGIMFFSDPVGALRECRRVLKPGCRVVFASWGPPGEHGYFRAATEILLRNSRLSAEESGALTPFKFSAPGSLSAVLVEAGFQGMVEQSLAVPLPFPGSPEEFWNYREEMSPPFRPMFEGVLAERQQQVKDQVLQAVREYSDGRQLNFSAVIQVASGAR